MINANTNKDEGDISGGWKQVRSGKATGTGRADKTINGIEKEDGMASYEVKTGIIEVRFMASSGKSCNITKILKQLIVAAMATNEEFTLMPISGIGNNLCYAVYVLNSKEGIEGYDRHAIKFNNVNRTLCIHTSLNIGKLKRPVFCHYLDNNRVHINKAQLGTDEGLSLGWIHKAHPTFAFRDGMKDQLQAMMNKEFKDIKYAVFSRTMKYKRSDGMVLTMNGIAIQVSKTENTSSSDFRSVMAYRWKGLTANTGGTLWGKTSQRGYG
jgi:hypothetical protein